MDRFTVGDMAEGLSAVEPGLSELYFARALRNYIQRGLMAPVGFQGVGRTAAAVFDLEQLCRARLISVLSRLGVQPEPLRHAIRCMDYQWYGGDGLVLAARDLEGGFRDYIAKVQAGEGWFFILKLGETQEGKDERFGDLFGGFTQEPKFGPGEFRALSTVVLDAVDLLGPLLRWAEKRGQDGSSAKISNDQESEGDGSEAATPQRSRRAASRGDAPYGSKRKPPAPAKDNRLVS